MNEIVNLTEKTLRQFEDGDTLYIVETKNDFTLTYFCSFKSLERGIVVAEIIKSDASWNKRKGEIRARSNKCYLYGNRNDVPDIRWNRCYWFHGLEKRAGEK